MRRRSDPRVMQPDQAKNEEVLDPFQRVRMRVRPAFAVQFGGELADRPGSVAEFERPCRQTIDEERIALSLSRSRKGDDMARTLRRRRGKLGSALHGEKIRNIDIEMHDADPRIPYGNESGEISIVDRPSPRP